MRGGDLGMAFHECICPQEDDIAMCGRCGQVGLGGRSAII